MEKLRLCKILFVVIFVHSCQSSHKKKSSSHNQPKQKIKEQPEPKPQPTNLKNPTASRLKDNHYSFWPGLKNVGNTCFFNSTIKLMSRSGLFDDILSANLNEERWHRYTNNLTAKEIKRRQKLLNAMQKLVFEIRKGKQSELLDKNKNEALITDFQKQYGKFSNLFVGMSPQDADEIFSHLANILPFDFTDFADSKSYTKITYIGTGKEDDVKLILNDDPIWKRAYSIEDPSIKSVQDVINFSYYHVEEIRTEGDKIEHKDGNKYFFNTQEMVVAPPKLLYVNFKRSNGYYDKKKGEFVSHFIAKNIDFNQKIKLPLYNISEKEQIRSQTGFAHYHAVAVIKHQGTGTQNGHYVAYLQENENGWRSHSDMNVSDKLVPVSDDYNKNRITSILYEIVEDHKFSSHPDNPNCERPKFAGNEAYECDSDVN